MKRIHNQKISFLHSVKKHGILVIGMARELCNRGIVLDEGNIISDSEIEEAMLAYRAILKIE